LNKRLFYVGGLILFLLSSCSGLRLVPADQKLYTGAKIELSGEAKGKVARKAQKEANEIIRPIPNSSFLGNRPSVWWYYKTINHPKGFWHWINRKLGEEPVYQTMADPDMVTKAINARLYNLGYFNAYSTFKWKEDSTSASVVYSISVDAPYTIKKVVYNLNDDTLSQTILSLKDNALIQPGQQYSLELLKDERNRIDLALKDLGYYYFNSEYIIFKADTSNGDRTATIKVELKPETPASAKNIYTIRSVNVYADYLLGRPNKSTKRIIDSVNYFSDRNYIRPAPILKSVFLQNGTTYSRKNHNLTLNRLSNLGVYKFVAVNIVKADSNSGSHLLDANVLLTPLPQKSLSPEIQGVSKSNNFIGPNLSISYRNRNTFKGAELLVLNIRTAFETQLNGPYAGQYTYEINPNIELYIPRFIVPFHIRTNSLYVPRTKFTLDFSYLSRVRYYDINSAKFAFGYKWKQRISIDHDISLVNINFFDIFNQSDTFLLLMQDNPTLAQRYEKQFIAGISYSFYYNQQVYPKIRSPFYFNFNIDLAGNGLNAIHSLGVEQITASGFNEILGVKYAQFIRADIDVRKFYKIGNNNKASIASRIFAGWGYPYGNSSTMPYIKQYFSGGAYSLRGFPVYSVGPGTYTAPDSLKSLYFIQQGGEIKLEGNIEYRFTLVGILKGALFADAGNVWLNNDNPDIPGGKFLLQNVLGEMAVDLGTGLRFDIEYFVLRLDLGMPVHKPWLPEGERWVFNQFDLKDKTWRRNNLILNLAFGYPF
jgi:outer membrane protein insertion porin family